MHIVLIVGGVVVAVVALVIGWACCAVSSREDVRMSEAWRQREL
jgi:hypothetical protein